MRTCFISLVFPGKILKYAYSKIHHTPLYTYSLEMSTQNVFSKTTFTAPKEETTLEVRMEKHRIMYFWVERHIACKGTSYHYLEKILIKLTKGWKMAYPGVDQCMVSFLETGHTGVGKFFSCFEEVVDWASLRAPAVGLRTFFTGNYGFNSNTSLWPCQSCHCFTDKKCDPIKIDGSLWFLAISTKSFCQACL